MGSVVFILVVPNRIYRINRSVHYTENNTARPQKFEDYRFDRHQFDHEKSFEISSILTVLKNLYNTKSAKDYFNWSELKIGR